jgi:hypothetical protein
MDRTGASVDCFPVHPAFPDVLAGRHPYLHFRGLLRLYSRYGPLDRSTAQRRPLSRGSDPASRPARPLVSYQINRQLSGWNLPPLVKRAFGTHRTYHEHSLGLLSRDCSSGSGRSLRRQSAECTKPFRRLRLSYNLIGLCSKVGLGARHRLAAAPASWARPCAGAPSA